MLEGEGEGGDPEMEHAGSEGDFGGWEGGRCQEGGGIEIRGREGGRNQGEGGGE